jgi:hypothetical protein
MQNTWLTSVETLYLEHCDITVWNDGSVSIDSVEYLDGDESAPHITLAASDAGEVAALVDLCGLSE